MSDFRGGDGLGPWLELELGRQLRPVAAPESLWERISSRGRNNEDRRRPHNSEPRLMLWPALTLILLAASCVVAWQIGKAHSTVTDMSQLTGQELQNLVGDSTGLDFQSGDSAEIRQWIKTNAGLDVKLPASPADGVRLIGARLIQLQGLLIAAVAYRVNGNAATLLVSQKRQGSGRAAETSRHLFTRIASTASPRLISWNMQEQVYAVSYSGSRDAREACQLCHADPHSLRPEPQL